MKLLYALLIVSLSFSFSLASTIEKEEDCRTYRINDRVYSLSFIQMLHDNELMLNVKRLDDASIGHDFHGSPPFFLAENVRDFGMEKVQVIPSTQSCENGVKIVQATDKDGNQMELEINFASSIRMDGFDYYRGKFNIVLNGQPLHQIYQDVACNKSTFESTKAILIAACKAHYSSKTRYNNSGFRSGIQ